MNFLDNSGHIFSLQSYTEEPIGHEFEENDYIFWIDSPNSDKLSVNNFYSKTINLVVPYNEIENKSFDDIIDVTISIDSNKFWLLKPLDIQEIINDNKTVKDYIDLQKFLVKDDQEGYVYNNKKLTNDDLFVFTISEIDEEEFNDGKKAISWPCDHIAIIPIYIISTSEDEGTWMTNILVHVKDKEDEFGISYSSLVSEDWCSITVGGEYIDENEILTVNGQNMGIKLPKELYRAIYKVSFLNDEFNESIYNEKIKEYLINYMSIRGEIGNYKSAISSLNWFGYGDKIQLTKLIKTDNQIRDQYINDAFNISFDILKSFRYFRNTTLLSLKLKQNNETGDNYKLDISNDFWGEGKPILEDLFNKQVEVPVGLEDEKWSYWKPYYDYSFYEMGLKISCLKYYYETYFLPIHLKVHSASVVHKVYTNDIKFNNYVYNTNRTESQILLGKRNQVEFDTNNVRYFTHQLHYVDQYYNEFNGFDPTNELNDIYKIDETCLNVPIRFINNKDEDGNEIPTYFNCTLLLEKEKKENEYILPYRLNIYYTFNIFNYDLSIISQTNENLDLDRYNYAYSLLGQNCYSNWYGGYNNFKEQLKKIFSIPLYTNYNDSHNEEDKKYFNMVCAYDSSNELFIEILWDNLNITNVLRTNSIASMQVKSIKSSLKEKIDPSNSNVYNIDGLINKLKNIKIRTKPYEYIDNDWYVYIPSLNDFSFNPMHIEDVIGSIVIIPKMNFKMKFDDTEIKDIFIENKEKKMKLSLKENTRINYVIENFNIFESHFSFIQNPINNNSYYNCFVLWPKILNKDNINYFVDQKFKIKLLVNDRWYFYEFISKMPDLNLQFGSLKYKYWSTTDNYYSKFSQLRDISPYKNRENPGYIKFNSFMYEPEIVNVDHINYYEDMMKYIKLNNIRYFNHGDENVSLSNYNKYIYVDNGINNENCKIYLHKNLSLQNEELDEFIIYKSYIDNPTIMIMSKDLIFVQSSIDNEYFLFEKINQHILNIIDLYFVLKDSNYDHNVILYETNKLKEKFNYIKITQNDLDLYLQNGNYQKNVLGVINFYNSQFFTSITKSYFKSVINDIIKIKKSPNNKEKYEIYEYIYSEGSLNINHPVQTKPNEIEIKFIAECEVYDHMISDVKNIYQKFDFDLNINKNNYLNNIHIFDIYEPYSKNLSVYLFENLDNVRINSNGVTFSHTSGDSKVYLDGVFLYDEEADSRFVDLYGFYFHNWNNEKNTSVDHNERMSSLDYHRLEQFINDNNIIKYYYYKDLNGNPTTQKETERKETLLIAKIIVDTLDDIKNIYNHDIDEYFDINISYNDFKGFTYIDSSNPKILYLKSDKNETIPDSNKKIFIKVTYVDKKNKDNYSVIDKITNSQALDITNNIILDNIKILVEFYEYINIRYNNILTEYTGTHYQGVKDGIPYEYFNYGNPEEEIILIKQTFNEYIDERNNCIIPTDEIENGNMLLGNPAFRFLKVKVNNKINEDGSNHIVINEEDKSFIDIIQNNTNSNILTYNPFVESLNDYLDFIDGNYESDKYKEDAYKKINDIYTFWNYDTTRITPDDLKNREEYDRKLNIIKKLLEENKNNGNPYINLRDYIVERDFSFNDIKNILKLNEYIETNEFIFDWYTNNNNVYLVLEIYERNEDTDQLILKDTITQKNQKFILENNQTCKLYIKVKNNYNVSTIIDEGTYIEPLIYTVDKGYQKLRYLPTYDEYKYSVFSNNNEYIYGNNKSKDVIDLYNEFFKIDYMENRHLTVNYENPAQTENIISEEQKGIIEEAEKIYQIEEKYLIWRTTNILDYVEVKQNTELKINSIVVSGIYNGKKIEYYYSKLNGNYIFFLNDNKIQSAQKIIRILPELIGNGDTKDLSLTETSNLINLIKYDFSVRTKIDFYTLKVYKVISSGNEMKEVQIDEEYLLKENYVKLIKSNINLKKFLEYDFYLMHDFEYWYAIFISKQTINKSLDLKRLTISGVNKEILPLYVNGKEVVYKRIKGQDDIIQLNKYGLYSYDEYLSYDKSYNCRYNINIRLDFNEEDKETLEQIQENILKLFNIIVDKIWPNKEFDETLYFYIKYTRTNNITHEEEIYQSNFINSKDFEQIIFESNEINILINIIVHDKNDQIYIIQNDDELPSSTIDERKLRLILNKFIDLLKIDINILKSNNINLIFTSYEFDNTQFENKIVGFKNYINSEIHEYSDWIESKLYSAIDMDNTNFIKDDYIYPEYENIDFEYENNTKYLLKFVKTGNEFLINRMQFVPNNGINHFNKEDMIVGKIINNPQLPINVFNGSKWEIKPISYGHSDDIHINSNSEMALLSFPSNNNEYERGYYDVNVRYSLDSNTTQQYIKNGKLRIG